MKPKPLVFVSLGTKGGTRKSRSMALLYYYLLSLGINPIVIGLDTNNSLLQMISRNGCQPEPEFYTWDLNDEDQSRSYLKPLLLLAEQTGRPIVLDLPAKGGNTLGIKTILRTGILECAHVVGIAPVLPEERSLASAIEAIELIKPDGWIKFAYREMNRAVQPTALHQTLEALNADATATIGELTLDESNEFVENLPVLVTQLADFIAEGGISASNWIIFRNYWQTARASISDAIVTAVPELFPGNPGKNATSPEATSSMKRKNKPAEIA